MIDAQEAKFIDWVRSELQAVGRGGQSALARWLGVDRSQITQLIKGRRQHLTVAEQRKIVEFFYNYSVPPPGGPEFPANVRGVMVLGRVGNHWVEESSSTGAHALVGSPELSFPYEEQQAFELLASSRDGDFREGDFIYTVPFATYRNEPLPGDEVLVVRRKSGLISYVLQRVHRRGDSNSLISVLEGTPDNDPQAETTILGLVVGSYRPRSPFPKPVLVFKEWGEDGLG
jgi:hypothetical protein